MKRQTFNLDQFENKNLIWRRLIEVTLYDFVDKVVGVDMKNDNHITDLLKIMFNGKMIIVESIREWLYLDTSKPTQFEVALIYDKYKAPYNYIKQELKLANTNINAFNLKKIIVKPSVLTLSTLQSIQEYFMNVTWTKLDYSILKTTEL